MPKRRIPKYRHYKPKKLAVVRIEGKDHYLGRYDSAESWEKYHRLVAESFSNSPARLPPRSENADLTVEHLIYMYWCAGPPILRRDVFHANSLLNLKLLRFPSKLIAALWRRDESRKSPHPTSEILADARPCRHSARHRARPVRHRPHSQLGGQQCQCANSATIKMRPASQEIAPKHAGHGIKGSRRRAH